MTKAIVTTSINGPTEAIRKFAAMDGWTLVDVLDKKSPEEHGGERLHDVIYLNCVDQEKIDPKLSELIGWNCIQRRNFGFIYAIKELKADVVATVDDDNVPMDGWGTDLLLSDNCERVAWKWKTAEPVFDPMVMSGYANLWHRGFPIQLLQSRFFGLKNVASHFQCDIQADFWNGDPDVDAICRMEHAPDCSFQDSYFPFFSDSPSPFNSQNTFLRASVIPHYFMFPGIGRMDDIWASYHVQAQGFKVAYNKATVTQKRNDHDLTKDFTAEIFGYQNAHLIVPKLKKDKEVVLKTLPERSLQAFEQYQTHFS